MERTEADALFSVLDTSRESFKAKVFPWWSNSALPFVDMHKVVITVKILRLKYRFSVYK